MEIFQVPRDSGRLYGITTFLAYYNSMLWKIQQQLSRVSWGGIHWARVHYVGVETLKGYCTGCSQCNSNQTQSRSSKHSRRIMLIAVVIQIIKNNGCRSKLVMKSEADPCQRRTITKQIDGAVPDAYWRHCSLIFRLSRGPLL